VVWQYSGVRALYDDDQDNASKVTRDYRLELETNEGGASILSVLGGKITTFRALAEEAVNKIAHHFPGGGEAWTKAAKLPGGDLGTERFEDFVQSLARSRQEIPAELLRRLARRHGANLDDVIGDARTTSDLGCQIGSDLYEREVIYLKNHEWAKTPEDVLWRRTKAGLHLSGDERSRAQDLLETML